MNPTTKKVAVVMAAGKGTRMNSSLPKVLVPVAGRPMIEYVLDALVAGGVDHTIVVVGYQADMVKSALESYPNLDFAYQEEQLGTGHAVMCCREKLQQYEGAILVVAGDAPMMQEKSIAALLDDYECQPAACILGTAEKDDPTGLGRVLRDAEGRFEGIVEEKDATEQQRCITEVNMSYYVFRCSDLLESLEQLRTDNSQSEYYLTDCPGLLRSEGKKVRALKALQTCETLSINTLDELELVEVAMQSFVS